MECMVTPLSPAARRQIIAFDPADPDAVSVTAFCKSMKISRRSFYTIRARHMEESQGALHPRSSAPHNTQRKYDETVTRVLLEARADLKSDRSEEHTSELQSRFDLVCRLLLEKKKTQTEQVNKQ